MASSGEKTQYSHEAHQTSSRSSDEHKTVDYVGMSPGRYLATRIPTLKPAFDPIPNPFKTLALLNTKQWLFFFVAFFGWTW